MSLTFESTELRETQLPTDPLDAFDQWFQFAEIEQLPLPESCALATCTSMGRPSVRIVLYKGRHEGSFLIFTNYESRKAAEIDANPYGALAFHWPSLERQIRIEGEIAKTARSVSEKYFSSRPRGSQIGAWASTQSEVVGSARLLQEKVEEAEKKFATKEVPCPPNWGGYALMPKVIEFWQGRASRLHDRFRYTAKGDGAWNIDRLSP